MNALTKSLARNRALRTSAYDGALRTRAAGGIVNIAPAAGFSIFGDQRQQSADRHRYAQNRGWLYAAVNALASAGAMQPAVVAKLLGAPEPTGKLRTKSASKAKHRLAAVTKAHAMRKMTQRARTKAAAEEFEVMTTHPILDVIESPNSVQSRWQFVYCFIASLCLTGMAYIVGGEGEDGKFELYSLPTTWVTPKHEKGPFAEFEIRNPNDPAAEPEIMTRENVAFAMLPNPANPLAAISPAATQATSIRIQEKIEASQDQYFDNGIFPSVIVTVGKDPHPEVAGGVRPRLNAAQRRQVHAAIGKVMSGVSNYGSPAIVDGLIEAITKFSNSADEMGWQQSEEIVKKRILSAFCVHPYILGEAVSVGGYAQVANIEARFFERVNTYLDMLGGCITNFVGAIVGARTKERLLVWWEQKVPNDPSLRWSNLNAARARGDISQNEIRAELGLAPDEDKTEQKIDAATAAIVVQTLPIIAGGQMTSEQAQALFEGLGIEPDLAERLAGDGAELQAAQQELQAASAALQAPPAEEGATEAEEVEKAVSRLLGGFGRGSKVFCPTGPGGGVDPTCSPGGGSGEGPQLSRKEQIKREISQAAAGIEFDDEKPISISSRDYDEIEAEMTSDEQNEMEEELMNQRDEWVESRMEDYETNVTDEQVADNAGVIGENIEREFISIVGDNEAARKIIDDWRRKDGLEGIDDLRDRLDEADLLDPEMSEAIEEFRSSSEDAMEKARESLEDMGREYAEESFRDEWDGDEARNNYLREFYDDNEGRFASSTKLDTWQRTSGGDYQYKFEISDGREFNVNAILMSRYGADAVEIQFSDDGGRYSITGRGGAFEVFKKVVPATVAYIEKNDPDVVTFSASGESRQKLYDRLTSTVLGMDDSRFAAKIKFGGTHYYAVGRKSEKDAMMERLRRAKPGAAMEEIEAKSAKGKPDWEEIKPEINPDWFKPGGWRDGKSKAFCPTGPGGGIDNSCSPKRGGGAAPADRQPYKTKEELYAAAKEAAPKFELGLNHGEGVDRRLHASVVRPGDAETFKKALTNTGNVILIAPLKGEKRAEEKVNNKYQGDWSRLKDVVRATVAVDSKHDIPQALEALNEEMGEQGWELAEMDDRVANPLSSGYRDIQSIWRHKETGMLAELQVNTKPMILAKEGDGHKVYEEYRSLVEGIKASGRPPTSDESAKIKGMETRMSEIYEKAWSMSE